MHEALPRVAFGTPRTFLPPTVAAHVTAVGRTRFPPRTICTDAVTIDPASTGTGASKVALASCDAVTERVAVAKTSPSVRSGRRTRCDGVTSCGERQAWEAVEWYDCGMTTQTTDKTKAEKDFVTRLADAGEEALQRIADLPGGQKALTAYNDLKTRVDELGKKVRGIDALEERVAKLEKEIAALKKPKAPARKQAPRKPAA